MGHLSVKHLAPLRNSFMPSRRQRRLTGPLYLAIYFSSSECRSVYGVAPFLPDPNYSNLRLTVYRDPSEPPSISSHPDRVLQTRLSAGNRDTRSRLLSLLRQVAAR